MYIYNVVVSVLEQLTLIAVGLYFACDDLAMTLEVKSTSEVR